MSFILRPPPRTDDAREASIWLNELYRKLVESGAIAWTGVDKAGSNITDIITRVHDTLQNTYQIDVTSTDITKNKHASNALGKGWEDHRTSHNPPGVSVASATASTVAVTGTAGGTYTATEQTMLNDLVTAVNQHTTDLNNAISQLNSLLASLRTITIINT